LVTIVAVAAAVFALVFAAAPWFALRDLQAAARDGDVLALAELVDYDAVRTGLRAQLASGDAVPAPKLWEDPLGALAHVMRAPQAPAEEIDGFLAPPRLHALIGDPTPAPGLRYWGPARVRFAAGPRRATLLTFQRRGVFSWRLVQLRLPPNAPVALDG
jgi:hypothetical protein